MDTSKIEVAMAAIPEKKESLRKALEALRTHLSSSSSSSFRFPVPEWNDLEAHISSIEATIRGRFQDLQAKEAAKRPSTSPIDSEGNPSVDRPNAEPDAEPLPRPELRSLCVDMDGKGLVSFVANNRRDLTAILSELTPALRSAPDPGKLVLDALELFFSASSSKGERRGDMDVETLAAKRTCINLLERIPEVHPVIEPSVRNQAKTLAAEWKTKVTDAGRNNGLEVIGLLQLISAFGLASEFKLDEILDLLLVISRRKQAVDLCKSLGLIEHVPDLIEKLNKNGRQFDAVRLVYAFNLVDKYPPVPLLRDYIKEIKRTAEDVRSKGNNSSESENVAISKELGALKCVLKAVEEYKLESQYPRDILDNQIAKLERRKDLKKRASAAAAVSSKNHKQQYPHKRPRLTAVAPNVHAGQNLPPGVTVQGHYSLAKHSPRMGLAGAYGYATAAGGNLHNTTAGGPPGFRSQMRPYLYSSESFMAGTAAGLYERTANYSGYPRPGVPPPYNPSFLQVLKECPRFPQHLVRSIETKRTTCSSTLRLGLRLRLRLRQRRSYLLADVDADDDLRQKAENSMALKMEPRIWHKVAAISGVAALGLGTYGAHGFRPQNDSYKEVWRTASLYHLVHTAALVGAPITRHPNIFGGLLTTGILAFSGSCYITAYLEDRKYSTLAPFGGFAFIGAWACLLF